MLKIFLSLLIAVELFVLMPNKSVQAKSAELAQSACCTSVTGIRCCGWKCKADFNSCTYCSSEDDSTCETETTPQEG